jgi:hypothetical protein
MTCSTANIWTTFGGKTFLRSSNKTCELELRASVVLNGKVSQRSVRATRWTEWATPSGGSLLWWQREHNQHGKQREGQHQNKNYPSSKKWKQPDPCVRRWIVFIEILRQLRQKVKFLKQRPGRLSHPQHDESAFSKRKTMKTENARSGSRKPWNASNCHVSTPALLRPDHQLAVFTPVSSNVCSVERPSLRETRRGPRRAAFEHQEGQDMVVRLRLPPPRLSQSAEKGGRVQSRPQSSSSSAKSSTKSSRVDHRDWRPYVGLVVCGVQRAVRGYEQRSSSLAQVQRSFRIPTR